MDRTRTPWLIFAGHRSMYVSSYSSGWLGDNAVSERLRFYVEPLLLKYRVNLAVRPCPPFFCPGVPSCLRKRSAQRSHNCSFYQQLWGHTHLYERTCPVFQQSCQGTYAAPQAPVHNVRLAGAFGLE